MQTKIKILFICQHNSGRSQIAEAYLNKYAGDHFNAESAGMAPAERINPLVVQVMNEEGIDLSEKKPRHVLDLFKEGKLYDHVVTVCDEAEPQCPVFPGITERWHYSFPDPSQIEGTDEEKLQRIREIRDNIKEWLLMPGLEEYSFKKLIE